MRLQSGTSWGLDADPADAWQTRAACRTGVDPELFHPHSPTSVTIMLAQAVCNRCPYTLECLREGVEYRDWESVRGGFIGRDRERYHREGLTPEQYPTQRHEAPTRICLRCRESFAIPNQLPNSRICSGCRWKRDGEPKPPCACGADVYALDMCRHCYNRSYRELTRQRRAEQRKLRQEVSL